MYLFSSNIVVLAQTLFWSISNVEIDKDNIQRLLFGVFLYELKSTLLNWMSHLHSEHHIFAI